MRTSGNRGAGLVLALLIALAVGATVLGGLGAFAKTAYAQKVRLCEGDDCGSPAGGQNCSVTGYGGCGCSCTADADNLYPVQCVCGGPVCRLWTPERSICLMKEVTCYCACGTSTQGNICQV